MAEEILDKARDLVEGQIVRTLPGRRFPYHGLCSPSSSAFANGQLGAQDFEGQRRAEGYATLLLALSALVAFNVGYLYQDIQKAVYIGLGGTALTFLAVVPPWPVYNKNPVKWLPAGSGWQ
ncbi:hypothetical protein PCL_01653 [Purpureocillium lilacinum]|uniref:Signal peptidase complex subunit 1 n=1 Tax=Purpureocillium lilacinum TaxID=33203 RepID=A0A2U3E255_PURLI|nr:hypothetical protein PCL_01653 [Purpureocillium lilacinum]